MLANYRARDKAQSHTMLWCVSCMCAAVFMPRTLSSVFLVQEFGLTVGQDLNFRGVGALGDPGRHQGVEVLQTGHLGDTGRI